MTQKEEPGAQNNTQTQDQTKLDMDAANGELGTATLLVPSAHGRMQLTDRLLSKKMNEEFLENESFRNYMLNFFAPRFRLMELPVELRVMIAEYALSHEPGIFWTWTNYNEGEKSGKFVEPSGIGIHDSKPCNPFSLVCKQLAYETRNITYKVNTLNFDSGNTTNPEVPGYKSFPHSHTKSFSNAANAWEHFRKLAPPSVLAAVSNVDLSFCIYVNRRTEDGANEYPELLQFADIASQSPHIKFQFYPFWNLPDFFDDEEEEEGLEELAQEFLDYGHRLERGLSKALLNAPGRTWRVRTDMIDEEDRLRRFKGRISTQDWKDAKRWIENGL